MTYCRKCDYCQEVMFAEEERCKHERVHITRYKKVPSGELGFIELDMCMNCAFKKKLI